MEDKKSVDEVSAEGKSVREAIREALKNQGRAHIICLDPQKDGTFTPFIAIDEHTFKSFVFYCKGEICLEMYEPLLLDAQGLEEFRGKVKRADRTLEPTNGEKRSVRFCITKEPEHLMVAAIVPINVGDGREKIVEALRAKLSCIITMVTMLYFGIFDGPEKEHVGPTRPVLNCGVAQAQKTSHPSHRVVFVFGWGIDEKHGNVLFCF